MPPRVYYHSFAGPEVYALIRAAAGADFTVVTLEADDEAERLRRIADCEVVVCAATPLRARHIEAARALRLVHHQGVGWQDTVDWPLLAARSVPLALTPEGTTTSVAEHTVLLILAALRRLPFADAELRRGHFHVNALRPVSRELAGLRIGYVGMGRIARAVAERLRAFGCSGLYADPEVVLDPPTEARLGLVRASLEEVLAAADVLTLHLPLTAASRGLIDRAALARMKPGAVLVNTARGGLVDERALAEALACGRLLAAGLDVLEEEPPPPDHPLLALPGIVLTPHVAAGTRDAMEQKMAAIFANLRGFFATGALANQVRFP